MRLRSSIFVCAVATVLACSGCEKQLSIEDFEKSAAALTQSNALGTLTWDVKQDGTARVLIKDKQGKPVSGEVTGELQFASKGDTMQKVSIEPAGESGIYKATGVPLKKDVTEMKYALVVDGKPVTGTLYLPEEGTAGIAETSKSSEAAPKKGPHGGAIQVIGDHRYEVIAAQETGEVRVYVLDEDLEVSEYRPKQVRIAAEAGHETVHVLTRKPDADFYSARIAISVKAPQLTLLVSDESAHTHVALVGYRPGARVVVSHSAVPFYWVHRSHFHPPGRALGHYKHKGKHHHHGDGHIKVDIKGSGAAHGVDVHHVGGDRHKVKVDVGHGKPKVKVKVQHKGKNHPGGGKAKVSVKGR